MDSSKLAERLRAVVGASPVDAKRPTVSLKQDAAPDLSAATVLGGEWRQQDGLSCFVVERRAQPESWHGRERLGAMAARLAAAADEAALILGRSESAATPRPPFVFFDLETTGLSGGAGTFAFLVGCGSFDRDGGFVTRQYVLLRHTDERQLLQMVGQELARAGALVSFNGKSFDAPVIETRHQFHRLEWSGARLPHLDVLHPARRFWNDGTESRCSLAALEGIVLGAHRRGDVPGAEIPARYFRFMRSGDAAPLSAVLEHNRLDLLSLAGLTAYLLDLVRSGPEAARDAREALALGCVYLQWGHAARALAAYTRAFAAGTPPVRLEAARALARLSRRARRYDDAVTFWRELLEMPGCPAHVCREANEALAVHHEHRARDLGAAKAHALRSLAYRARSDARPLVWQRAVEHRLARIERKMSRSPGPRLDFEPASSLES